MIIMMKNKIYIIGALKNAEITSIAAKLRQKYDIFDSSIKIDNIFLNT